MISLRWRLDCRSFKRIVGVVDEGERWLLIASIELHHDKPNLNLFELLDLFEMPYTLRVPELQV